MIRNYVMVVVMLLSSIRPCIADEHLFSAFWAFWAPCKSFDLVYDWQVHGTSNPGSWHIDPWEDTWISIRAVELVVTDGPTPRWLMAGNGHTPDPMAYMAPPERHVRHDFPAGTGMLFPSKQDAKGPTDYLDLHGGCVDRNWFGLGKPKSLSVEYIVYYTKVDKPN